jgi:hypothetical protein
MAALNKGDADFSSMSCASAGNCSAGGTYTDAAGDYQVFVVSETGGVWQQAQEVPGTAALNTGGNATVNAVSCAAPGSCSAGGNYVAAGGSEDQPFVVSEVGGVWQRAEPAPGMGAIAGANGGEINAVSCTSPGNCTAGGDYGFGFGNDHKHFRPLVVSEVNGVWQQAGQFPGPLPAALNPNGTGEIDMLSCASPGNCSAGGDYAGPGSDQEAMVVSEVSGVWQRADALAPIAALNKGKDAEIDGVACAGAGSCSAVGDYSARVSFGSSFMFTVNQLHGSWQPAAAMPGNAPGRGRPVISAPAPVSCGRAGYCGTAGLDGEQAFAGNEVSGAWQPIAALPGAAALSKGRLAQVDSLSCPAARACVAAGEYTDGAGHRQLFVASQVS